MSESKTILVDPLFEEAARLIVKEQRGSTSRLQRSFQIGYNRASLIMDELENTGIVSDAWGARPREVLIHDEASLENHLNFLNYEVVTEYIHQTSILGISRLRMGTDGHGITTLVAFYGCPLRCRYCLNPECNNYERRGKCMLPEDVMGELRKDELYYVATKGGVTFGGGEPLLNSQYIKDILELGAKEWNVTVETSLNVPVHHVKLLMPYIDEYIIDIKDMNPEIYQKYTGQNNWLVKENLQWLIKRGMADRIICRIPLIEGYNIPEDQEKSKAELLEMGITRFDLFSYTIEKEKLNLLNKASDLESHTTLGILRDVE
jgi:pyruvate formate lyase activating enzyme